MDSDLDQCWYCRQKGKFHCEKCQFAFYCSEECEKQDRFRHEAECERAIYSRTCKSCGNRPATLLRCGSCFLEFYCNKACQLRHLPQHKSLCKAFMNKVVSHAENLEYISNHRLEFEVAPRYINRDIAEDYLRLHQNEGSSTERELRLLFVGIDDIKDVVRTVADLPAEFKGKLQFVLNHHGSHVSARNLLFIYCAVTSPIAEHLVHIWYSVCLTPKVLKYLLAKLKELTTLTHQEAIDKMRNCVEISSNHWSQCVHIWKGWHDLALSPDAAEKMAQLRQHMYSIPEIGNVIPEVLESIPKEHHPSVKDFFEHHLLLPMDSSERRDGVLPNCTMTCYNPFNRKHKGKFNDVTNEETYIVWNRYSNPKEEMVYCVRAHDYVLCSWDYFIVKETVGKKDDLLYMYVSYLTSVFQTFVDQITSGCATFHFIVDEFWCLNQYLGQNETFDRISTFNLSDFVTFPLLFEQFGPRLNKENKCSVLITHHINWISFKNPYEYEEKHARKAMERKCKAMLQEAKICLDDYIDTTPCLFSILVCEVVAYSSKRESVDVSEKLIKQPERVAGEFGLCLRDYCSELNHVVPFKRDITLLRNSLHKILKRYLEWTLLPAAPNQ